MPTFSPMLVRMYTFLLIVVAKAAQGEISVFTTSPVHWPNDEYRGKVTIVGAPKNSSVTLYIPFALRNAEVVVKSWLPHYNPMPLSLDYRYVFDAEEGELTSATTSTGSMLVPEIGYVNVPFNFEINGTEMFPPIRFPVTVCPLAHVSAGDCWSNEVTWASPTAYDWILSCRMVAVGSLVFWTLAVCIVCACLARIGRMRSGQPYEVVDVTKSANICSILPVTEKGAVVIGDMEDEEMDLLVSAEAAEKKNLVPSSP